MKALKAFSKGVAWALFVVALAFAIWTLGMTGHPIAALGVYWAIPSILTAWGAFDYRRAWREADERLNRRDAAIARKLLGFFYVVVLAATWAAHIFMAPSFPRM